MKQFIAISLIVLVVVAFIVGSNKGNAAEKEAELNALGARLFLSLKQYTSDAGINELITKTAQANIENYRMHPTDTMNLIKAAMKSARPVNVIAAIAQDIYKSKKLLNDDENATYAAFSNIRSLVELEKVNLVFFNMVHSINWVKDAVTFGLAEIDPLMGTEPENIIDFMNGFLNDKEKTKCYNLIKDAPVFIVGGKKYFLPKT